MATTTTQTVSRSDEQQSSVLLNARINDSFAKKKDFDWHREFPQDRKRFWSQSEAKQAGKPYPYDRFLPTFDGHLKLPPLTVFEHSDRK